ncbi:membrane-associated protein [Clostridium pascui]|uniref:DedA family protein n=1 Tax=Clostridium pascui TaxID=46609 RepID=UPI00195E14C3|nr:DedA family protein [Clostridium pascui]MBM7870900.1 membrane-associated protein [Clostridium pascui]
MQLIQMTIDFILHIDTHLSAIVQNYGMWSYAVLFLIVFCETGLVVLPFLPGDSLIFAAGALVSVSSMNIFTLLLVLMAAAIVGDTVNYEIGKLLGRGLYENQNIKFIKKEYLDKTNSFYDKHGGKTIILARFAPIVRTFAPFVAGMGKMHYSKFISYNIVGGITWVALFTLMGYFFGNLPAVQHNFTLVIFAIILVSVLPGAFAYLKSKLGSRDTVL